VRRIVGLLLLVFATGCSAAVPVTDDLGEAVTTGDVALVEMLLDEGADPDQPLAGQLTPLMRAANRGHAEIARLLIDAGADPDGTGFEGLTALHLAAGADSVPCLEVLLQAGADTTTRDLGGMGALDHAAHRGATGAIEHLVTRAGFDPNAQSDVITQGHGYPRDRGLTPMAIAVRAGRIGSVDALIDVGANPNGLSAAGQTPLLTAVFSDQPPDLVSLLLRSGADDTATARCDQGCSVPGELTASQWAAELERADLLDLLASG
jgi:ankyrin repeat protein